MNCKNCQEAISGNFCTHCGQSTTVDKINLTNFLKEASGSIFQINKGVIFTIKELFIRPGETIQDYLKGKRKYYSKPIAYAFALSTIYFLISRFFGSTTFINEFASGWALGITDSATEESQQMLILDWFDRNYGYTVLLLLPIFSLASYLAFRKFKMNYLEHMVLNAYITGHQAIFYTLFAIVTGIFGEHDSIEIGGLLVSIGYAFMVFWQFFTGPSRLGVVIRTAGTYLFYLLITLLVTTLVLAFPTLV